MIHKISVAILFLFLSLILAGCPPAKETAKEETPPPPPVIEKKPTAPDITLITASIDLSAIGRRIEKKDVESFSSALKKEKVDILAVQGINRYPGVATRIDVFEEIGKGMEMRSAFGESMTLTGRQTGNAVFSTYPIKSNDNVHYNGISSTNFESALLAVIDGGSRDIVVVSTLLPEKPSAADLAKCTSTLTSLQQSYAGTPMIVTGNVPTPPKSEITRELEPFKVEQVSHNRIYRIWYTAEGLKTVSTKTIESSLGTVILTQFGLYRKPQP